MCANISEINLVKNLMIHFRPKHIGIKRYFIQGSVDNSDVALNFFDIKLIKAVIFIEILEILENKLECAM